MTSQGNTEGADYIFELMHPAEQALVGAWGADERPDSPTSPFGGGYPEEAALPSALVLVQGLEFIEQSEAFVVEAQKADDRGDVFEMSTVFLAVTLFLAGVATLLHTRSIQRSVLSLSAVMLVIGTIVLLQAEFT